MPDTLELRRPRLDEEDEVLRAHQATTPEVPHFLHHYQDGMPFRRYLEVLDEQERGVDLPPGQVPSTFLFAFVDERIVGRVSIRHRLTDALTHVGGHVGYVVVPEFRRRGYATVMLRLALDIAREQLGHRPRDGLVRRRQRRLDPDDRTQRRHAGERCRRTGFRATDTALLDRYARQGHPSFALIQIGCRFWRWMRAGGDATDNRADYASAASHCSRNDQV